MIETTFNFISIYWLIPVTVIFAFIGLGLFHRLLGAIALGGVAFIVSLIAFDSYLNSYTEEWLQKQRVYAILFRDFPKDKANIVSGYSRAFEISGKEGIAKKHEEMKVKMMVDYAKHYIENTPTEVLTSYIKAQTWLVSELFRKDYNVCLHYLADYKTFEDAWKVAGDNIFKTSVLYNPFIITEAVYRPQPVSTADRARAMELYRKLIRTIKASGARLSNDGDKVVSCDTIYREFYALTQMPPNDAALVIKLIYSEDHLKLLEPMTWLRNLMPF